ncbi:hypothetical protein HR45_00100 [Shewanella mangrovi]|uniref:Uncharacterized protein n=2 Tax=Shewanella mangrovi TaxID=1515746 RepID=A0A094LUJ1_9GAMM|nr:hypothetical protein HR45_00100 [Shewanella mangrovi]
MFGSAVQQAMDNVSTETNSASAQGDSDDSSAAFSLFSDSLASELMNAFYQAKISSSITGDADNTVDDSEASATTSSGTVSAAATDSGSELKAFAEGNDFSMWDALDVINPLQHIPLLNYYYRDLTGDDIGYVANVTGGTLFGGALGALGSLAEIGFTRVAGETPLDFVTHQVENLESDELSAGK